MTRTFAASPGPSPPVHHPAPKRPPVRVTIKGHTYRSTVAVMGGEFMVGAATARMAIDDAKTPETRQRRIDKAVVMLRDGRT